MKWTMHDSKSFTGEKEGYIVSVKLGGLGWVWVIIKDEVEIDNAYYHSPTNSELAAKSQAERCLDKIINNLENKKQ